MVKQKVSKQIIKGLFNFTRRTITGISSKEAQLHEFKAGKTERGILKVLKETKTLRQESHVKLWIKRFTSGFGKIVSLELRLLNHFSRTGKVLP